MSERFQVTSYESPPWTFTDFTAALYSACAAAWDGGHRDIAHVTLPEGVFPEVLALQHPVSGVLIPVRRIPLVTPAPDVEPGDA